MKWLDWSLASFVKLPKNLFWILIYKIKTFLAIDNGYNDIVNLLLTNKASNLNLSDYEGRTPLMNGTTNMLIISDFRYKNYIYSLAVEKGNTEIVSALVSKNVNVDNINNNGETALFIGILNFEIL